MSTAFKSLVFAFALVIPAAMASQASAGDGHFHGGYGSYKVYNSGVWPGAYSYGFARPVFHQPTVQYRKVYHPGKFVWTPAGGYYTKGHFDYVPTYVPGHFDTFHNGHIDSNPWYH